MELLFLITGKNHESTEYHLLESIKIWQEFDKVSKQSKESFEEIGEGLYV